MKVTQYTKHEKAIAEADSGGIYERWLWGLRLLHDPGAMSSPASLRHGVTEQLTAAARGAGLRLSEREIRYRLQCARAYPTEGQIGKVLADFAAWWDIIQARFPAVERDLAEPDYDWRTGAQRRRDTLRAMALASDAQQELFPADQFDEASMVSSMRTHADSLAALAARMSERCRMRLDYVAQLEGALRSAGRADGTWETAAALLAEVAGTEIAAEVEDIA